MAIPVGCSDCHNIYYVNDILKDRIRCERCEEIRELRSLSLWMARRLPATHKKFAYDEYEEITGEKTERE